MILIGNQMVYSPKGSGNYKDLDKTRVKLFPTFTRHHLITHTNHMEGWGLEYVKKSQGTWTIHKETLCTLHGLPQS